MIPNGHWTQVALAWWLIATLVLITIVDTVAILEGSPEDSVSAWIYGLGQRWPTAYLLLGAMLGHLLFPLRLPPKG